MTCSIVESTMRDLGREYTDEEREALNLFHEYSKRLAFEVHLNRGEANFVNNYGMLHARTEFIDWDEPSRKRLMLRLWLDSHKPRKVVREINIYENESGRSGTQR